MKKNKFIQKLHDNKMKRLGTLVEKEVVEEPKKKKVVKKKKK